MLIGYARVSKTDGSQSLDLQRDALRAAGIDDAANWSAYIRGDHVLPPLTAASGFARHKTWPEPPTSGNFYDDLPTLLMRYFSCRLRNASAPPSRIFRARTRTARFSREPPP